MTCWLLADGNPLEAVSRYLQNSANRPDIGYVVAAGTALLLLACGWAVFEMARKWIRDHATTLPALASELSNLHDLTSAERSLLVEASRIAPPVEPAFVYVDPDRLGRLALARPELADRCGKLAEKLFGTVAV